MVARVIAVCRGPSDAAELTTVSGRASRRTHTRYLGKLSKTPLSKQSETSPSYTLNFSGKYRPQGRKLSVANQIHGRDSFVRLGSSAGYLKGYIYVLGSLYRPTYVYCYKSFVYFFLIYRPSYTFLCVLYYTNLFHSRLGNLVLVDT